MVHRRELAGQELVFGNQGALWGNAMTWWDHDTGSVWSQPRGEAIAGPRKGAQLELLPSTLTSWDGWRTAHPHTLALDAPGGDSGFRLEDMAIVVDLEAEAAAYLVEDLRSVGVINDVVAGVELVVWIDPGDDTRWAVFARSQEEGVLTFARRDEGLVDLETGSVWDPVRGLAVGGELSGRVLARLPAITSFPRDFWTFWPQGRIWEGPGT